MNGFYTVQFQGVQGWGAGVATLIGGRIFGGDSGYLYSGTYTQNGTTMKANVHVSQYVKGMQNVMGRSNFDLELNGTLNGSNITVAGTIPGTPLTLKGMMTKQGEIPAA